MPGTRWIPPEFPFYIDHISINRKENKPGLVADVGSIKGSRIITTFTFQVTWGEKYPTKYLRV